MIDFAHPARSATSSPRSSGSLDRCTSLEDPRLRRREQARLGDEIARLSAHIQAATYRLLELIRAFDVSGGWHAEGFLTCAGWLSWRTGIAPGAAREKVRVARAGVRFHRPDGSLLPAVPPASSVPSDPVAELKRSNRDLGIDAWTATPSWAGDRLDLDYAVMVFAGRSNVHRDVSAETSAGGIMVNA